MKLTSKKGKFIVIDGVDGSGKATQTELLAKKLRKNHITVRTIDFPQYEQNLFGELIGECLRGEHGKFAEMDPRIASTLYAADRFESKKKIEEWLSRGYVVIADRYVSANQLHQGGKIHNPKLRREFLEWLDSVEHGVFGLPRPTAILYLDIPISISSALLRDKKLLTKKKYTKGKLDTVEQDITYQINSQKSALSIVKKQNTWYKVDCAKQGVLRSRQEIHDTVIDLVSRILKKKLK